MLTAARRSYALLRNPLVLAVYVPTLIFSITTGIMNLILPLYAAGFGVPYSVIGLIVAADLLGTLLGDVPAGVLMRRLGKKRLMMLGLALNGAMTLGLYWAQSVALVGVLRLASGLGWALFGVSRHAYLADMVSPEQRGRAIAIFGGTFRIGWFIGPSLGGFVAARYGLRATFLVYVVLVVVTLLTVLRFAQEKDPAREAQGGGYTPRVSMRELVRANYHLLAGSGIGQILAQMTRASWRTIIPLYGADVIGLEVEQIGLIMSALSAVDMSLFLPAGVIMDRWGRRFATVPSFALQGIGLALIPLTGNFAGLLGAGLLIGVGNGLGSGTMMTIGADLAPEHARGEFLGLWRLVGDTGAMAGPLVAGGVADLLTLSATALVAAAGGLGAALIFARWVPETLRRRAGYQ